jgi:hypothetical protein
VVNASQTPGGRGTLEPATDWTDRRPVLTHLPGVARVEQLPGGRAVLELDAHPLPGGRLPGRFGGRKARAVREAAGSARQPEWEAQVAAGPRSSRQQGGSEGGRELVRTANSPAAAALQPTAWRAARPRWRCRRPAAAAPGARCRSCREAGGRGSRPFWWGYVWRAPKPRRRVPAAAGASPVRRGFLPRSDSKPQQGTPSMKAAESPGELISPVVFDRPGAH